MSAVPTRVFARRLRSLDHETFCTVVADLWEATGWETTVRQPVVVAQRDDRTERLLVVPAGRLRRLVAFDDVEDVDKIVSPRVEDGETAPFGLPDAPVVDAEDLRHRLLYAIDDDRASEICREHLDMEVRGTWEGSSRSLRLETGLVAVVGVVLLTAGVLTLLGAGPLTDGTQPVEASGETTFDGGYNATVSPATAQTTLETPSDLPRSNVVYATTLNGTVRALSAETGETLWSQTLVDRPPTFTPEVSQRLQAPIVDNGTVYLSAFGGAYALDARDGTVQWRFEHESNQTTQPTVVGERVYVSTGNRVVALDARSGERAWAVTLPATAHGSPTVRDDTVYTATEDGIFYALDAATGEKLRSGVSVDASYRAGSAVVADVNLGGGETETRYLVAGVETMFALDAETGAERWSFDAPWTILESAIDRRPRVADGNGTTTRDHGRVYLSTAASGLFALNATTGELQWIFNDYRERRLQQPTVATWQVASNVSDAVSGRTVFVPSEKRNGNGSLHAVVGATGDERWSFDPPEGRPLSATVADRTVYTPATNGRLYALNASTGEVLWSHNATQAGLLSVPTVVRTPIGGRSVDSSVSIGTAGHHAGLYEEREKTGIRLLDHEQPGTIAVGEEGRLSVTVVNSGQNTTEVDVQLNASWNAESVTRQTDIGPSTAMVYTTTFEAPARRGTYEYELRVGDQRLTGSSTVVAPPSHEIAEVDAQSAVYRGDLTEVLVTIRNVDNVTGTTPLAVEFDGEVVDRTARTVDGNDTVTATLSFEVGETLEPGNYTYAVATGDDVQLGSMEVRAVGDRRLARSLVAQTVGVAFIVVGLALSWWVLVRVGVVRRVTDAESPLE